MPILWPPGTSKKAKRDYERALKHRKLCFAVVKEALAWYRANHAAMTMKFRTKKPQFVDQLPLEMACSALEKFETGARK